MTSTRKRAMLTATAAVAASATLLALVYGGDSPDELAVRPVAEATPALPEAGAGPTSTAEPPEPEPSPENGKPEVPEERDEPEPEETEPETGNPGALTKTIRHGPYEVPAAVGDQDGRSRDIIELGIETPCGDCYITSITPNMVYEDGSVANVDTGPGLHHFLLTSQFRADPVCGQSLPNPSVFLGERFAAAGNERTVIAMPTGYGIYNAPLHRWNMASDFMNHAEEVKEVYVEITYEYVPASTAKLKELRPVWLDVAPCGSVRDTYQVPAGGSTETWDWEVNVPGRVIALGGHAHNGSVNVKATNLSTGETICDSVVGYGEKPEFVNIHGEKEVSSLKKCLGTPVTTLERGQTVRLATTYETEAAIPDAMGIMVVYIEPTP
ncbi:hypothetical protein WEI85_37125 [Actinomycetes bacterium KLBMP 9797]